jgi:hypothetical protein
VHWDVGTGVAPMRALMHERIALATSLPSPSLTMLLFGCRSQADDYLYESEWLQCVQDVGGNGQVVINCTDADTEEILPPFSFGPQSALSTAPRAAGVRPGAPAAVVVTAFSRRGRHAGRRVTHSLRTHQQAVWSLIRQVGRVIVCLLIVVYLANTTLAIHSKYDIHIFCVLLCVMCTVMAPCSLACGMSCHIYRAMLLGGGLHSGGRVSLHEDAVGRARGAAAGVRGSGRAQRLGGPAVLAAHGEEAAVLRGGVVLRFSGPIRSGPPCRGLA